jgi:hypothetical protein
MSCPLRGLSPNGQDHHFGHCVHWNIALGHLVWRYIIYSLTYIQFADRILNVSSVSRKKDILCLLLKFCWKKKEWSHKPIMIWILWFYSLHNYKIMFEQSKVCVFLLLFFVCLLRFYHSYTLIIVFALYFVNTFVLHLWIQPVQTVFLVLIWRTALKHFHLKRNKFRKLALSNPYVISFPWLYFLACNH